MRTQPKPTKEPRIKDSCQECAKSKLKCSRDKPACKRCQSRGFMCLYCPSQRAGRISTTKLKTASSARPRSPLTPNASVPPTPEAAGMLSDETQEAHNSIYENFDFFRDFDTYRGGDGEVVSLSSNNDMDLDQALPENLQYSMLGSFDMETSYPHTENQLPMGPFKATSNYLGNYRGAYLQLQSPPPSASTSSLQQDQKFHSCFDTASKNLTALQSYSPTVCTHSSSSSIDSLPTINNVIDRNRMTIDSISTMLACPCSLDGNLAAIISLIAFKVMAWYAAVARDSSLLSRSDSSTTLNTNSSECGPTSYTEKVLHVPTRVGKYHIAGDNQPRMRAQLVLSELHRVQRFLEALSKRLQNLRQSTDITRKHESAGTSEETISASVFVQLEADLRRKLTRVSKEAMDILKEG